MIPDAVIRIAGGREVRVVWANEVGGVTCEVRGAGERIFVKWVRKQYRADIEAEVARLRWAVDYVTVPRVLDEGEDGVGAWMVTQGLPGENAIVARWKENPKPAIIAIGEGLRAFHDALPVADCPFSWGNQERIASARQHAATGTMRVEEWQHAHRHLTVDEVFSRLEHPPSIDKLVVCQGDACSPNTLITGDGRWSGHVDLGQLGVADRWADLAVATAASEWNYGPGWETLLLDAYGVDADEDRTQYYRLLWDAAG